MYQPDPPGLIHDDPRLLPPWRGSSLFSGKKSTARQRGPVSVSAQPRLFPQICIWDWCPTLAAPHGEWVTRMTAARSDSSGVLAVLTDPQLRDEFDRVAAAVGVRVVHAGAGSAVSRKTWSAAVAVVLLSLIHI